MNNSEAEGNEHKLLEACEFDSRQLTRALISEYRPIARRAVKISDWPDELLGRNLNIHDQTTNQVVADVDFDSGPDDRAYIILPDDYTRPLLRDPFVSIESPEMLPPAGKLIFEIIEAVDWIIMSPHAELTTCRELESLLCRLHEHHDYSSDAIRTRLVAEAQDRGDIPISHD